MSRPTNPIVAAAIAAHAPTPAGFFAKDLPPALRKTGYNSAVKLAKTGKLIKAHGGMHRVRFFTDAGMAAAHLAACAEQHRLEKIDATQKASAWRRAYRAAQAKAGIKPAQQKKRAQAWTATKPKKPAPPPVVQTQPANEASPPRSMFTALKPSKQAEIIYPPNFKKTVRLMPDCHISRPYLRIGEPGFAMSI